MPGKPVGLQIEHGQCLIQGAGEAVNAQIIGTDESITSIQKHPDASASRKGGIHAGDPFLLRKKAEVIGVFQKNFHQVGTSASAAMQQGLKGGTPGLGERFSQ